MKKIKINRIVKVANQTASVLIRVVAVAAGINVYNKVADKVNSSKGVNK